MKTRSRIAIAAIPISLLLCSSSQAETVIGRWCTKTLPNLPKYNQIIEIAALDSGEVELRSKFNDGSSATHRLQEGSGGIYIKVGSASGDKYRIVPSTGDLQLLDKDGLIGVATRLENTPKAGECSR